MPAVAIANPMNIRTRSSSAVPRSNTTPQYTPITGNAIAAMPNPPLRSHSITRPALPAASNQSDSTERSANTTRKIPNASRAQGARWVRTGVRVDAERFFEAPPRPDDRDPAPRFVFVVTYTSRTMGRITGFRLVTSQKYFARTRRTFCCRTVRSVTSSLALPSNDSMTRFLASSRMSAEVSS